MRQHHRTLVAAGQSKTHEVYHSGRNYGTDQMQFRSRYNLTIANMEQSFAREDFDIGVYETKFSRAKISRLSRFLAIEPNHAFTEQKVNICSKKGTLIGDHLSQTIKRAYRGVYDYCETGFLRPLNCGTRHLLLSGRRRSTASADRIAHRSQ